MDRGRAWAGILLGTATGLAILAVVLAWERDRRIERNLDRLLRGNVGEASAAAADLAAIRPRPTRTLRSLIPLVGSEQRARLALALGRVGGGGAREGLLTLLGDEDPSVRGAAAAVWPNLGRHAVPVPDELRQVADGDPDTDVRLIARRSLERIREREGP